MSLYYTQASAGSGKTTSIEKEVTTKLVQGDLQPSQIMAVTFTNDAAAELKSRISEALLMQGHAELAIGIMSARIGTVHAVFGQLLSDFAFELGLSPRQRVLDPDQEESLFYEALDHTGDLDELAYMNQLASRLSIKDWRKDVLSIVQLMRTNGFNEDCALEFKQDCVRFLLDHLPKADSYVSTQALKKTLHEAIVASQALIKPTKGLLQVIEESSNLLRQAVLTWQHWLKISKFNPTKMGDVAFAGVKDLALNVLKSPEFQQDMVSFIEAVFDRAQHVLHAFAALKKERGFIDFTDQEVLAQEALNHPIVQSRIRADIAYLIVDEFQDTSPIQMAIFAKMSELVDDVLMVGDAKQAIYGFRGSDPKLALSVLDYIQHLDAQCVSSLPYSWRSRSGLVALTNELFTSPFAHLLKPEQVRLIPKCSYHLATAELGWWTLNYTGPRSGDKIYSALAEGIREHIVLGVEIWDKQHKKTRPALWRDVAVLFRKNSDAQRFAHACAKIGLPVSLARAGLLQTPEVSFALACLRVVVDASDSLACAEVLLFVTGTGPEVWLASRLEAVANATLEQWNNESHDVLTKLVQLRSDLQRMSVREVLELALMTADVAGIVTLWQETAKLAEHRLANVNKLISFVDDYENHCLAQCSAATVAGFILWLRHLEQIGRDEQAPNPGDAIRLATYHASKGLEWPIVVCCNLDAEVNTRLFGARIVDTNDSFDWHQPLAGRILRYCPSPFPDHQKNNPLIDAFRQSKDWQDLEQQARNEAIQLLYVGMTRARDQLILTTVKEPNAIGEQLHLLNNPCLPPKTDEIILLTGEVIGVSYKSCLKSEEPVVVKHQQQRWWFSSSPGLVPETAESVHFFSPASLKKPIEIKTETGIGTETKIKTKMDTGTIRCSIVHDFQSRLDLKQAHVNDMEQIGKVLHQCIALIINAPEIAPGIIEQILLNSAAKELSAKAIIAQSHCLLHWILLHFDDAQLHTEYPFLRHLNNKSVQQGAIDLVIETKEGFIVIDHKSNPQPKRAWEAVAAKYSGQLSDYRHALMQLSGKEVLSTMIHFFVSGGLVEVSCGL